MFVKICGLTTVEDALLAVAMGADALGFVFAPSPRQMPPGQVRQIVDKLPAGVLSVGLFRNHAPSQVIDTIRSTGLNAAQLHGNETADETHEVRAAVPYVLKAFAATDPVLARVDEFAADVILIDNVSPGSGQTFDWSLTDGVGRDRPMMLAGGLHPGNVAEAIARVRPWGVDVSSGVESSPGVKDPRLVKAFIENAKAAPVEPGPVDANQPYDWGDE